MRRGGSDVSASPVNEVTYEPDPPGTRQIDLGPGVAVR